MARRKASEALKKAEREFLKGAPEVKTRREPQRKRARKHASKKESLPSGPKESITVRLDPDLARELRKAVAMRSIDRRAPYTQTAVVTAALRAWLAENA